MCFTVSYIERKAEEYAKRYRSALPKLDGKINFDLPHFYLVSGFSHPYLPIVKSDGIFLFQWGLIPSWSKDEMYASDISNKTLNAVGETIFEKPSFRKAIVNQRCILGVNGFFEWREFNKQKYPYYIHSKTESMLSLGCIYDIWLNKTTGELHHTFSILTTEANPLMAKIHNLKKRMPLILSKEAEKKWIDPTLTEAEIKKIILPSDESELDAYTLSKAAGNTRYDRNIPEILNRVEYAELEVLMVVQKR